MLDKKTIRQTIREKCATLTISEVDSASYQLFLQMKPLLTNVKNIAIYNAHNKEINLKYLIEYCQKNNIIIYQPVAYKNTRQMKLALYGSLDEDIFSDESVIIQNNYAWYNLDMIIMPLLAVGSNGYRVGQGGGYYDTTLSKLDLSNTILCGVGYDFQYISQALAYDEWDTKLDIFVSPNMCINF